MGVSDAIDGAVLSVVSSQQLKMRDAEFEIKRRN